MHGWSGEQWFLYNLNQYLTGISYFIIPASGYFAARLARINGLEYIPVPLMDDALFRMFVFLCGLHHLTHPEFMRLNMYWPMISVDFAMMAVSVLTAVRRVRAVL